jgi:hypothetical protein
MFKMYNKNFFLIGLVENRRVEQLIQQLSGY